MTQITSQRVVTCVARMARILSFPINIAYYLCPAGASALFVAPSKPGLLPDLGQPRNGTRAPGATYKSVRPDT